MTEDEILQLVEDNHGRLHQREIVTLLPWSKATVSRTIHTLADQGELSIVPLGHENLICLPDRVPSIARTSCEVTGA